MEQNAPSNRYRFPKSRSKNFKKALGLAEALKGFEEADGFYWVEPTAEERAGKKFQKLVSYSKNWKDAGFFVDDTEVTEADWPKLAEEQNQTQASETVPPAAVNEAEEVSVTEESAEESSSEKAESTEATAAKAESPDEPPTAGAEPEDAPEPKTKVESKNAETSAPEQKETSASTSKGAPAEVKSKTKKEAPAENKNESKPSNGPSKIEVHAPPEEPTPPMAVAAMWVLILLVLFLLWKITFGSP